MGVIDISPAVDYFADKIKGLVPTCQDPEKEILH